MKSGRKQKHIQVTKFNSKVVRDLNRSTVLGIIRDQQPISRAKIAQMTNLNKSTVSSIVNSLLDEMLLEEQEAKSRNVGRNPINLRLKTGKHFFGAIYLDSALTRLAIVDIQGTVLQCQDIETDTAHPEQFIVRCIRELEVLRAPGGYPEFMGIGITVAGIVDSSQAKVVFAPNLGWEDLDIGKIVGEHCPDVASIALENDAKASAISELWFGHHDIPLSNFVFLLVDRGVGAGVVVDRRILNGDSHSAGEFGHMTIIEGGERCTCGNDGCWEMYASDRATVSRYVTQSGLNGGAARLSLDDVIREAEQGNRIARDVLMECGYFLGIGIVNIIKSVDPATVIIGGRITRAWNIIYPEMMSVVTKRGFYGRNGTTSILPTSLAAKSPLLGAAALAIRTFFSDFKRAG
jgi:predicted NBD/HSP70 family sugar kinase